MDCIMGKFLFCRPCPPSRIRDGHRLAFGAPRQNASFVTLECSRPDAIMRLGGSTCRAAAGWGRQSVRPLCGAQREFCSRYGTDQASHSWGSRATLASQLDLEPREQAFGVAVIDGFEIATV